ncbi:hypothetical protein VKI21_02110 [Cyanobacterium aponinum UTEX 3222]|uniref:hypothetical protein n=1 Tax=Cyanobacterium aponinum TaxID=379064 RepID=UPI003084FC4E|nr:hypothetical protein VKI21_02110 [Cyanobacterium aponinum UTEX 3222]
MKYYSKENKKFIAYWRGTVNGEPKWGRRYVKELKEAHQWFNEIVDGGGVLAKTAIVPLDHPFMKLINLR